MLASGRAKDIKAAPVKCQKLEQAEALGQKHKRGIGVIHRHIAVLLHSPGSLGQMGRIAEVQNLETALRDELCKEGRPPPVLGHEVHRLGNDRAGCKKLTGEGVEVGGNSLMVIL